MYYSLIILCKEMYNKINNKYKRPMHIPIDNLKTHIKQPFKICVYLYTSNKVQRCDWYLIVEWGWTD